jgi:hypothetical protein
LPRAIGPADSIPAKPGHGNADRGEGDVDQQDATLAGASVTHIG